MLKGLAQARRARSGEPPSPRRGLEKESRSTCAVSLRRDPSRLGEMLTRSKRRAGRLGDLSRKSPRRAPCLSRLGETDPLGRDLQVSPLVHLEQPCFSNQPNIQSVLTHQIERLNHTSSN